MATSRNRELDLLLSRDRDASNWVPTRAEDISNHLDRPVPPTVRVGHDLEQRISGLVAVDDDGHLLTQPEVTNERAEWGAVLAWSKPAGTDSDAEKPEESVSQPTEDQPVRDPEA